MAEQLTLEQAAANVAKAKEQLDILRRHRNELNEQLTQAADEFYAAVDALEGAKQELLQIALQTKGER